MSLIADVGLSDVAQVTAVELPYGRKRALEIATTLALDPEMLLLDEPTAGMGHEDIERITALIKRVSAERTVLMVEHNLSVVENLCHRITVLTRGRVLAEGDYATVANNPQVKEAYMGTGDAGPVMLDVRAPLLVGQGSAGLVRRVAHPARRDVRRAPGRGGDAARDAMAPARPRR